MRLVSRLVRDQAEAEDVVQEAYLRWHQTDRASVRDAGAVLVRTVTRLCLDILKSARVRREQYMGTWLPEPIIEPMEGDDLTLTLMMALERLSPLERAAFLLHDVFDMGFADIADVLERSEAAVRQLASRARAHVRDDRPRFHASDEEARRLADAFQTALTSGDVATLSKLLAEDAVCYADGGGKRAASLHPIHGRDDIVRFVEKIIKAARIPERSAFQRAWINGMPGFVVHGRDGVETVALEIGDGLVVGIYIVRNPDKLRHLA